MSLTARGVRDGLAAGLLAGFVLAVLFYFYDIGQGAPLRTPAFLWGAILQKGEPEPTAAVVIGLTMLHFVVWAGLGLLASVLIGWAGLPRNLLIGAAYGLFVCSLVFYVALVRAPIDQVLSAPGWPAVFFGNALAGVVMFTRLHWVGREPGVPGMLGFLQANRMTRHGITAGVIGAVTVAIWFLIVDTIAREPFFTPAALGALLFRGGAGGGDIVLGVGPVVGYSFVHFTFFLLFGVTLSGLAAKVRRSPPLVFGLLLLFVALDVSFVTLVAVLGRWILGELAWWSVLVANALAAGTMGSYMWRTHPELADPRKDDVLRARG